MHFEGRALGNERLFLYMKKIMLLVLIFYIAACQASEKAAAKTSTNIPSKPNILIIMVDDMGHADLSSFGSEIPTPHLDSLANKGIKLSQFITSSVCSPTRASLLTGLPPHQVGFGNLAEELAPNQQGQPGYEGYLSKNAVTIAEVLKDNGYATMMVGKWHLGKEDDHLPSRRGFSQTFAMLTNASHFSDMKPAYSPTPNAKAAYTKNGQRLKNLPDNFRYSTEFYADELIQQIDNIPKDQPFFAFLSYSAPHWPLQAPKARIEEFMSRYQEGYDSIAVQRLEKQKQIGLIPHNASLAPRPPKALKWSDLNQDEQKISSKTMAVYAAMIAEIDTHTGRVIKYLEKQNKLDTTLILFMSDNGPEGHDLDETWPREHFPDIRRTIDSSHDFSYENIGLENSYTFYGAGWAWASSPAFYAHKGFQSEGGVRTSAFVYGPKFVGPRGISHDFVSVRDIPATILAVAGIEKPGAVYNGKSNIPMQGRNVLPILNGVQEPQIQVHIEETMGKISIRKGNWKLVKMPPPFGNERWNLFNVDKDLSEQTDLSSQHSDKRDELLKYWQSYQQSYGVILPDWVSGY